VEPQVVFACETPESFEVVNYARIRGARRSDNTNNRFGVGIVCQSRFQVLFCESMIDSVNHQRLNAEHVERFANTRVRVS
jgi:hypothetical protein